MITSDLWTINRCVEVPVLWLGLCIGPLTDSQLHHWRCSDCWNFFSFLFYPSSSCCTTNKYISHNKWNQAQFFMSRFWLILHMAQTPHSLDQENESGRRCCPADRLTSCRESHNLLLRCSTETPTSVTSDKHCHQLHILHFISVFVLLFMDIY